MATLYCTRKDIEQLLSEYGLDQFVDQAGVVDTAISRASAYIENWLCNRYDVTTLASHPTVNELATVFASWRVCQHRGNEAPPSLEYRYQQCREELMGYSKGQPPLCGATGNENMTPSYSNKIVDQRFSRSKQRVVKNTSSQTSTDLRQNQASWPTDPGYRQ